MKEIIYCFDRRGCYVPEETAEFKNDTQLRLIIEPHTFEMKISGEVIRSSFCEGYKIEVSQKGAARFLDQEDNLLAATEETEKAFVQVRFLWKQDQLRLQFGRMASVDYYPNCDGEHDRWGTEWVTEYEVRFSAVTHQTEITAF